MKGRDAWAAAAFFKEKLLSAMREARYLPRTLRLVWSAVGAWMIGWALLLVLQGLIPIPVVYLVRGAVNAAVSASAAHGDWPHIRTVLSFAIPLGALILLGEILRSLAEWIRSMQADLVSEHVDDLIQRKCVETDLASYENATFHE